MRPAGRFGLALGLALGAAAALDAAGSDGAPPAFADDFADGALGPAWRVRQGHWQAAGGVVTGRKDPASKHPAKLELFVPQRDGTVAFSFQTDQPGGVDFYFYQGSVRVAIVQLRAEGIAFATFPKTGPSEPAYLARGSAGLAPGIRHPVTIERRAGTVLVRIGPGEPLQIEKTGLAEETSSFLFIPRGPPETTLTLAALRVWRTP